ncbi:MAG: shikimate dehydrogenase [Clostridia bacterium]|nr:shikimate dehydrogenase [Clostridia bacterium]
MQFGLIGGVLGHSYSCEIHAAVADYEYELRELKPEEVRPFIEKREFTGINVTIPYKQTVMPFLDEISEKAKAIGAVNTIVNKNGKLYGYNTDFYGMTAMLEKYGIELKNKKVLVLGTGGTSKTANAVAKHLGAKEVLTVSRTKTENTVTYEEALSEHTDAQIIINTTPVGMFPNGGEKPVDISLFPDLTGVADAIYNPLRTNLVLDAREKGIPACGGLYMLAAQGVMASALFRDIPCDSSLVEKAFTQVENSKKNIVLIGMPTSGKTSVGTLVAGKTGRAFYDTDETTEEIIGMPIPDYIKKYGEAAFREKEKHAVLKASQYAGAVIATGGGAVLNDENVRALRRNGTLVFLNRSIEKLTAAGDRPLSDSYEKLAKMYETRMPVYQKSADIVIDGDVTVQEAAQAVMKEMKL